jgi:hypothetical protein
MPAETIVVVSTVILAFALFMVTLAGAALFTEFGGSKARAAPVRQEAIDKRHDFRDAA